MIDLLTQEAPGHRDHNIPLGTLVEIVNWTNVWDGIRLFVTEHTSSSDFNEPTYSLGSRAMGIDGKYFETLVDNMPEHMLKIVDSN